MAATKQYEEFNLGELLAPRNKHLMGRLCALKFSPVSFEPSWKCSSGIVRIIEAHAKYSREMWLGAWD